MNHFDKNLGYYEDQNLGGFSLKKAFKKWREPFRKVAKKVLPSSVRKIGRQLDKSGITKIAAAAAGLYLAAPLVSGGLKSAAAKKITSAGAKKLIKSAGTSILKNATKKTETATTAAVEQSAANALELSNAIAKSAEFKNVVSELRAAGYSDDEILQHWRESKTAYEAAAAQTAETIAPAIYAQAREAGMVADDARAYAVQESEKIAETVTKQQQAGGGSLLPVVAVVASMLII
jgi:hypothetical protein